MPDEFKLKYNVRTPFDEPVTLIDQLTFHMCRIAYLSGYMDGRDGTYIAPSKLPPVSADGRL